MAEAIVSAAQLREILEYDPESPSGLRWKVDRGHKGSGAKAGDRPGTLWKDKAGYRCWTLHAARKQWYAHRVVWMLVHGEIPIGMQIDHLDGDALNNRIENLRVVTPALNSRNQFKSNRNRTGVVGVHYDRRRGCYAATWHEDYKLKQKSFKVSEHGAVGALQLAQQHRIQMIERLNSLGAGYTDRHLSRSL